MPNSDSKTLRHSVASFLQKKDLYYGLARYVLGTMMIGFATMKITGMQFNTIAGPTSSYQQPLEYLTGIQLTWAFLGYSTWFQILLGIFEFVPSCLLLFRRTAFLGAIFLFPMTLGVFLINYGLHLWHDTQVLSLFLLALNIACLLFERNRLGQIASIVVGPKMKFKYLIPETVLAVILITFPATKKIRADYGKSFQNVLTGDWYHGHPYEFTLISEQINDSTLPYHRLKSYFGSWEEYGEINDSMSNWDGYKRYTLNVREHTLFISPGPNRKSTLRGQSFYFLTGDFHYDLQGDSLLILRQKISNSANHTWSFKKRIIHQNKDY